jgi:tRNA 5-methylaminomethyl-2-thiouridine biosynthesis bifunctional protein
MVCAGASYNFDDDSETRAEDNAGNLTRLEMILPGCAAGLDAPSLGGRVGFRAVPPDRLPLIGQLPDPAATLPAGEIQLAQLPRQPGLYALLGLASRGLVWAQLGAELLAAQIEDAPLPLESQLANALDPGRFWLRRLRRTASLLHRLQ